MSFKDVQIAFAGHNRPEDIDNLNAARTSLASALERLKSAGLVSGTLITGVADGADLLAAAAWDSAGLGPVHAVYPYLNDARADITATHGRTDTWLDGDSFDTAGRSAHLALTRWLVESADLLLVVWGGEAARGPGGTADAVSVARQRGVPVLWIRPPDYDGLYLITPPDPDDDISFNEFLQQIESGSVPVAEAATAERIAHQLKMRGFDRHSPFDKAEASRPNRLLRWLDDIAHRTVWRTYALFHNLAGGRREKPAPAPSAPADLANQPGFEILSRAYARADALAIRLSAVYRTQQLYLLCGAVAATVVGSSPAIWEENHVLAVLIELGLAGVAVLVWSGSARARRHERWSDARRLAEQLRLERAAWAVGLTAIDPQGSDIMGPAACQARAWRRRAGPAVGRFDPDRVSRWGDWAIGELVISQANYHRDQGHRNHIISHRMHQLENIVFMTFITILASFALGSSVGALFQVEMPKWIGGALIMTSAVVPAIGAAVLALQANLAFSERSRESQFLAAQLDGIRSKMPEHPRLHDYQRAASAAIRLHNTEQDLWAENAARRPLIKGA